jgi:thioredoxin-like negative regulator of GroEL
VHASQLQDHYPAFRELNVAVVFWRPDCWPCHVLAPTLEKAVEVYGDRVTFAALDITLTPHMAARLGVRGIPHLLFFARGVVCCHFAGEIPWVYLRDKLERALWRQAQASHNPHSHFTLPSQNSV